MAFFIVSPPSALDFGRAGRTRPRCGSDGSRACGCEREARGRRPFLNRKLMRELRHAIYSASQLQCSRRLQRRP